MVGNSEAPSYYDVMTDLRLVRERGAGRLRELELPSLRRASVIADLADSGNTEPAPVKALLLQAVDSLGGGKDQDAAELLLGLAGGTALESGRVRREKAAAVYGIYAETFRKKPEASLLGLVAEGILGICHEARYRRARIDMENQRHPADSRLAVQWVERFEAYYRLWTPVYALGANLEAALEVYQDDPSDHLPWDPGSKVPYDPIYQARGYARSALYNYAQFLLELKRFMSRHGGHWILSDAETEQEVMDTVYAIGWHNDLNDEDDSFLRRHLADSRHEETEHFWGIIQSFPQGTKIHDLWQVMVEKGVGLTDEAQKAATQVWPTIAACTRYCDLIDADWLKIADWYRPGSRPSRGISGKTLYDAHMRAQEIARNPGN